MESRGADLVSKAGAELVASAGSSLLPEGKLGIASRQQLELQLWQVWVEWVEVEVEWVEEVVGQGNVKAHAGGPHLGLAEKFEFIISIKAGGSHLGW